MTSFLTAFRNWPIRRKLIVSSLLSSGLALLLAGATIMVLQVNQYREDVAGELSSIAAMIATNSSAALAFGDAESARKTLMALGAEHRIAAATVSRPDGSVLATWTRPGYSGPVYVPHASQRGDHREGSHLVLYRPVTLQGETIGVIYVRSDMPEVSARLRSYGLAISLVMCAASLLALLAGTLLQRAITRPIRRLSEIALEVSQRSNYRVRAKKESNDEIGLFTDAFNGMLEQLESRDRNLEQQVEFRTGELTRANHDLIVARDRAEEGARLKSEFLANMSHEIRTPMNVIIGMTQITLETSLEPRQHGYLNMVRNSAESLLRIINDILDFSRIEAGKLDLEPVDFRLADQLNETTAAFVPQAQDKGIELRLRLAANLPGRVHGDAARLSQIIVNLLGNAIKFTAKGVIEISVWLESARADSSELHFTVSDAGIGIPPAKQKVIFDAFRQADGSTTRQYGGTGLGLSISRQLVHLMGGRIWVESEAGQGSHFHFTVRFAAAEQKEVPAAINDAAPGQIRAIVISQDPDYRAQVAKMLATWTIEAAVVDSIGPGTEVMKWSCRLNRPFSLMFIDLDAALAGSSTLQAAQQDAQLAVTPIILVGEREATADELNRCGAAASIAWPAATATLLDITMNVLRRGARPQAAESLIQPAESPIKLIEQTPSARLAGSALRILVTDDVRENRLLVAALCQKQGHELTFATNGAEAVAACREGEFDVVLMDIQMPGMGGVEATAEIRLMEAGRTRTPIIALTAHAMKGDREKYLAHGMDGYVSKPIQREMLFREIALVTAPHKVAA